jgi:hypothetical protein
MIVVDIEPSNKKYKRFCLTMNDGKKFDFGLKDGSTYIDHEDKIKRKNYWSRHLANSTENKRINNLVPSASLFSAYLLWGPYTDLEKNVANLNNLWKQGNNNNNA